MPVNPVSAGGSRGVQELGAGVNKLTELLERLEAKL